MVDVSAPIGRPIRRSGASPAGHVSKRHPLAAAVAFCIGLALVTLIGGSWFLLERTRQTALHAARHDAAECRADRRKRGQSPIAAGRRRPGQPADAVLHRRAGGAGGQRRHRPAACCAASTSRPLRFATSSWCVQDGRIWASARPNPWNGAFPVDQLNLAGTAPGGTAVVGGPLRNPVTGDWVLLVVRQVSVPGVGVLDAVAEVPLPLITVLFSAVGEIPGLRIALERRNGELLVSQPYDEMQIGKPQPTPISPIQANGVAFMVPTNLIRAAHDRRRPGKPLPGCDDRADARSEDRDGGLGSRPQPHDRGGRRSRCCCCPAWR